ncbi:MAG: hypothetical protein ABIZ04_05410 [Opitutus sp.]
MDPITASPSPSWNLRYIRSVWAMLLPYTVAYLFYALVGIRPTSVRIEAGLGAPTLLQIYWALHVFHLALTLLTARQQWNALPGSAPEKRAAVSRAFSPWLLLGLLFLIPGTYLEFPADTWEHLRRINEWNSVASITTHSHWTKTGYFVAYSLFGWASNSPWELPLSAVYVSAVSLLVCWQYYRLALALKLAPAYAFLFTLVQAVLFGTSAFSFYRYYGLASTVFGQLAAVALIRITVEQVDTHPKILAPGRRPWLNVLGAMAGLSLLIAANHIQGFAIAAIGCSAVLLRTCREHHPRTFRFILGFVIIASIATLLFWPKTATLVQLEQAGWLTRWGSFDFSSFGSAAFQSAWRMLGWFGILNLICGAVLLVRNRTIGWLTILPLLALGLPLLVIPITHYATQVEVANVVVLQRILFAAPVGLAVVALVEVTTQRTVFAPRALAPIAAITATAFLTLVPPGNRGYNRFWNFATRVPADLGMSAPLHQFQTSLLPSPASDGLYATPSRLSFVLETVRAVPTIYSPYLYRGYLNGGNTPPGDYRYFERILANPHRMKSSVVLLASPHLNYTPTSFTAEASGHWLAQEVAFGYAGQPELDEAVRRAGLPAVQSEGGITTYRTPTDQR